MKQNNLHPLRLNVGFLLRQSVGFSRSFDFSEPRVQVADDLDVVNLQGTIRFTRTAQGLVAKGNLEASITLECVRCLSAFNQRLTIEINDLFAYPPKKAADPLLAIPETGILDLSIILREYMLLDIPIQPICTPSCKGFCPICGGNRNEIECDHPEVEIDPRMAALQDLLSGS